MYNIEFYESTDGYSDIAEFLDSLRLKAQTNKDARIQYGQASRYIELLQENGTNLPTGIIKHLEDEIWELRPGKNRIFFFYFKDNTYVLLHHYFKKTQKTPRKEITKAKYEANQYIQNR